MSEYRQAKTRVVFLKDDVERDRSQRDLHHGHSNDTEYEAKRQSMRPRAVTIQQKEHAARVTKNDNDKRSRRASFSVELPAARQPSTSIRNPLREIRDKRNHRVTFADEVRSPPLRHSLGSPPPKRSPGSSPTRRRPSTPPLGQPHNTPLPESSPSNLPPRRPSSSQSPEHPYSSQPPERLGSRPPAQQPPVSARQPPFMEPFRRRYASGSAMDHPDSDDEVVIKTIDPSGSEIDYVTGHRHRSESTQDPRKRSQPPVRSFLSVGRDHSRTRATSQAHHARGKSHTNGSGKPCIPRQSMTGSAGTATAGNLRYFTSISIKDENGNIVKSLRIPRPSTALHSRSLSQDKKTDQPSQSRSAPDGQATARHRDRPYSSIVVEQRRHCYILRDLEGNILEVVDKDEGPHVSANHGEDDQNSPLKDQDAHDDGPVGDKRQQQQGKGKKGKQSQDVEKTEKGADATKQQRNGKSSKKATEQGKQLPGAEPAMDDGKKDGGWQTYDPHTVKPGDKQGNDGWQTYDAATHAPYTGSSAHLPSGGGNANAAASQWAQPGYYAVPPPNPPPNGAAGGLQPMAGWQSIHRDTLPYDPRRGTVISPIIHHGVPKVTSPFPILNSGLPNLAPCNTGLGKAGSKATSYLNDIYSPENNPDLAAAEAVKATTASAKPLNNIAEPPKSSPVLTAAKLAALEAANRKASLTSVAQNEATQVKKKEDRHKKGEIWIEKDATGRMFQVRRRTRPTKATSKPTSQASKEKKPETVAAPKPPHEVPLPSSHTSAFDIEEWLKFKQPKVDYDAERAEMRAKALNAVQLPYRPIYPYQIPLPQSTSGYSAASQAYQYQHPVPGFHYLPPPPPPPPGYPTTNYRAPSYVSVSSAGNERPRVVPPFVYPSTYQASPTPSIPAPVPPQTAFSFASTGTIQPPQPTVSGSTTLSAEELVRRVNKNSVWGKLGDGHCNEVWNGIPVAVGTPVDVSGWGTPVSRVQTIREGSVAGEAKRGSDKAKSNAGGVEQYREEW